MGKWHLGGPDSLAPWSQGFDYSRMIGKNGLDYYNYSIYENSYKAEFKDNGTHYLTDKLTDYATEFIQKRDPTKPFFLYLCYSAPHVFIVPRGDKVSKYLKKYEQFGGNYNPYYAAMMESLDDGVGRVLATLAQQGLLENTIVVFTSDNGGVGLPELGPIPTSAGTFRKWKGHVYEGGIRVPTIIAWDKTIAPNQTCDRPIQNTDYTPTFLELLGQPQPNLPDARSFAALLKNPQAPFDRGDTANRPLFWHYPHFSNQLGRPAGAVRVGDWKLVRNYETGKNELFNLKTDESETRDESKRNPQKTNELNQVLTDWLRSVDANMPIRKTEK